MRCELPGAACTVLSMFHVLAVVHAGAYLDLGIDECFERVSIGKRLNSSDVTKTVSTANLKQCTNECERILCNAYSYGVNGNGGNGTCLLGADLPKSGPYDDPEYDLFLKIMQCRDRTTCFIKLVGGRRLTDKYIQRTLPSETKGDCELYCEYEKEFRCEGFNFRYDMNFGSYSSCQLTSVPVAKLDLSVDFQSDVDYDFFEKNANASPSCRYADLTGPYGQRRRWPAVVGQPDIIGLWQDFGPAWPPGNDVTYGNDRVLYDPDVVLSTPATVAGAGPLLIRPNTNAVPLPTPDHRLLPVSTNECFIKARTGHHLQRENIVKSMNAPSLYGCETLCANEQTFMCNIFSYRYSFTSSMDNCHLGDKTTRQLDVFQDLVPDRDSDVFSRNELSQPGCQPSRNWDTDCFEWIRSGLTFDASIIKFSIQTENLHECELICLHVKHFTCRVFSFRRGPAVIGVRPENCYLTDYPVSDMDPTKHFVPDPGCDVYNRGSFGRGCELDKALPPSGWPPASVGYGGVGGGQLTPTVVTTTYRPQYGVPPPLESPAPYGPRYGPPPPPPVQLFPITTTILPPVQLFPTTSTTLLPPPSSTDFPPKYFPTAGPPPSLPPTYVPPTRPTGTYVPSLPPTTFFQYPGGEYTPVTVRPSQGGVFKDLFDPPPAGRTPVQRPFYGSGKKLCYINFGNATRLSPSAVKKSMNVNSEYQCKMECDKARESQLFRCSTLSYFEGSCELSDIEMKDLKPNQDFTFDRKFVLFTWDFDKAHCFDGGTPGARFPSTNNVPSFPSGPEWTWMRFTVNGHPCRFGSYCTQNINKDIWSCPVEHGDWDYCCRPDHKCGYSEGTRYPWCHVGTFKEHWRPCSDQYYPSTDGPPQTWPVTYIHREGPPSTPPTAAPFPANPSTSFRPAAPSTPSSPTAPATVPDSDKKDSADRHEPSLVDKFLSIFKSSSSDLSATRVPAPVYDKSGVTRDGHYHNTYHDNNNNNYSRIDNNNFNNNNNALPGFRVVDVMTTSRPYHHHHTSNVDVADKLFLYGTSSRFRSRFMKRKHYVQ